MAERVEKGLLPIWTMDIETDPFAKETVPVPFAVGLYDGVLFYKFWSDRNGSCIEKAKWFLEDQEKENRGIVYMHNGGRFDFFYLLEWFQGKSVIMSSRIVKAFMPIGKESKTRPEETRFEFRDSYAIMPFPLAAYKKDAIDIQKLNRDVRYKNRDEINSYLKGDCVYLWELCMEFQREFGDYLTIASAAFAQLKSMHGFETLPEAQDKELRKKFYYGGRVQCFQKGVIEQPCKIYDVNSMYPAVMRDFWHPVSHCTLQDNKIRWKESESAKELRTFFISVEGANNGAFPVRAKDGSVDFTQRTGIFHVSIHEWNAAMELGNFKPSRIIATYNFSESAKFDTFVSHFFSARKEARRTHDDMRVLFYKYILNSAYGKFALNPENYFSWMITPTAESPGKEWTVDSMVQGKYFIWKRAGKTYDWNLKNVATGASITGAARSILLRAIAQSKGVIYCDTDSIVCSEFRGGILDDKQLGAWKTEAMGDLAAIAGKKMYAIFDKGNCIKQANKGVVLTPEEILSVCKGENVFSQRIAPTFKRDGSSTFISRNVRMT